MKFQDYGHDYDDRLRLDIHAPMNVELPDTAAALAIDRIVSRLDADVPFDSTVFWQDVEAVGAPLVMKVENDERDVIFLWRSSGEPGQVYLRINRVTDKEHVAAGLMKHVGATDVWMLRLRLPASLRASYTFTEVPAGTSAEVVRELGGRFPAFPGRVDPLNTVSRVDAKAAGGASVVALDRAPAQREWRPGPHRPRGELLTRHQVVAGRERRVRLYLPDVPRSQSVGLLVLPDADTWIDHMGVLAALDAAIDSQRIGAFAVLGVDNIDLPDRVSILGGRSELVHDIAERLVPEVRAAHPDRCWADRRRTVICGQSLGGVTALIAAVEAPDVFGAVLSHSPSMWWTPEGKRRPVMFSGEDASWVTERVMAAPPLDVRVGLCVGSFEGAMVAHVERLHERLIGGGVDSDLTIYTGGHDLAWWRGALIDGLAVL